MATQAETLLILLVHIIKDDNVSGVHGKYKIKAVISGIYSQIDKNSCSGQANLPRKTGKVYSLFPDHAGYQQV